MSDTDQTSDKIHYICQTYIQAGKAGGLKVDKLLQYTTAAQAQERAEREARSDNCVGADAYMLVEDASSGEVGPPEFLARHGAVPEDVE